MASKPHIAVIGAGAFGGWTALYLLRGGARVTLIDCWGPGNSRASSGGETRIIRGAYGTAQHYTKLAARARELWKQHEAEWNRRFFFPIGVLWMAEADDTYESASIAPMKVAGIPLEELSINELQSGYLLARTSAQAVVDQFIARGGEYREEAITPEGLESGDLNTLELTDGSKVVADYFVFACGPWLGKLFPQTVGPHFVSTKQEIFFFGTPAGDPRYNEGNVPVWGDHSDRFMYGIPGNQGRGFKLADDTRGPPFDPTSGHRLAGGEVLSGVRRYLKYRFPGMKDAPLVETRVCQ